MKGISNSFNGIAANDADVNHLKMKGISNILHNIIVFYPM